MPATAAPAPYPIRCVVGTADEAMALSSGRAAVTIMRLTNGQQSPKPPPCRIEQASTSGTEPTVTA